MTDRQTTVADKPTQKDLENFKECLKNVKSFSESFPCFKLEKSLLNSYDSVVTREEIIKNFPNFKNHSKEDPLCGFLVTFQHIRTNKGSKGSKEEIPEPYKTIVQSNSKYLIVKSNTSICDNEPVRWRLCLISVSSIQSDAHETWVRNYFDTATDDKNNDSLPSEVLEIDIFNFTHERIEFVWERYKIDSFFEGNSIICSLSLSNKNTFIQKNKKKTETKTDTKSAEEKSATTLWAASSRFLESLVRCPQEIMCSMSKFRNHTNDDKKKHESALDKIIELANKAKSYQENNEWSNFFLSVFQILILCVVLLFFKIPAWKTMFLSKEHPLTVENVSSLVVEAIVSDNFSAAPESINLQSLIIESIKKTETPQQRLETIGYVNNKRETKVYEYLERKLNDTDSEMCFSYLLIYIIFLGKRERRGDIMDEATYKTTRDTLINVVSKRQLPLLEKAVDHYAINIEKSTSVETLYKYNCAPLDDFFATLNLLDPDEWIDPCFFQLVSHNLRFRDNRVSYCKEFAVLAKNRTSAKTGIEFLSTEPFEHNYRALCSFKLDDVRWPCEDVHHERFLTKFCDWVDTPDTGSAKDSTTRKRKKR